MGASVKRSAYSIVAVLWDDATEVGGWGDDEYEPKPCPILSVGFLVKRTKRHLILAQDLAHDGQVCGRGQIPSGMVMGIKKIPVPKVWRFQTLRKKG